MTPYKKTDRAGCQIVSENTETRNWGKVSELDSRDIGLLNKTFELIETYGLNPMDFNVVVERPTVSSRHTDDYTVRLRFETIPSFEGGEDRIKTAEMFADMGVKLGDLSTSTGSYKYQCPVIVGASHKAIYEFLNAAISEKRTVEAQKDLPGFAGRFR